MTTRTCKHHLRGKCWFKDKCRYSHPNLKLIKCKLYQQQACDLSRDCPYSHDGIFETAIVCFKMIDQHGACRQRISTRDDISYSNKDYRNNLDKLFDVNVFFENPHGNSFQKYGGDFKDVHANFDNVVKCLHAWRNLRVHLCADIVYIIVRVLHSLIVNLPVVQYGRMIEYRKGKILSVVRDVNATPPVGIRYECDRDTA